MGSLARSIPFNNGSIKSKGCGPQYNTGLYTETRSPSCWLGKEEYRVRAVSYQRSCKGSRLHTQFSSYHSIELIGKLIELARCQGQISNLSFKILLSALEVRERRLFDPNERDKDFVLSIKRVLKGDYSTTKLEEGINELLRLNLLTPEGDIHPAVESEPSATTRTEALKLAGRIKTDVVTVPRRALIHAARHMSRSEVAVMLVCYCRQMPFRYFRSRVAYSTISRATKLSRACVSKALRRLRSDQLLTVVQWDRHSTRRLYGNLYEFSPKAICFKGVAHKSMNRFTSSHPKQYPLKAKAGGKKLVAEQVDLPLRHKDRVYVEPETLKWWQKWGAIDQDKEPDAIHNFDFSNQEQRELVKSLGISRHPPTSGGITWLVYFAPYRTYSHYWTNQDTPKRREAMAPEDRAYLREIYDEIERETLEERGLDHGLV